MTRLLAEIFQHHLWANVAIADCCTGLDGAQLATTAQGAYGAIGPTLVHMAAAESRYLFAVAGRPRDPAIQEDAPFPGVAALRTSLTDTGAMLVTLAGKETDDRVVTGVRGNQPFSTPLSTFLIQSLEHGQEHRRQIAAALALLGMETPDLSGWGFDDTRPERGD